MSGPRHSGKNVRFNDGSQQSSSLRRHHREDERDSGLAADRFYQSNNPDALREAYADLFAKNQELQSTIVEHEATLSISHRTIKQLESHTKGLVTERDELKNKNEDYKSEIVKLRTEIDDLQRINTDLQRINTDWQEEVVDLREQMIKFSSGVSDKMSGGSGTSGTSGSGTSSNNLTRRPSKRENQEKERLKDRFNRSTPNDAPVASTSAIPATAQRQHRPSKVVTGRPYIEEPDSRPPSSYNYNLVARPAPGHEQARVPRSSQQATGDYQFHPLPQEPSRRR